MRLIHWVNAALLAALVLGSAWAYPRLPERIPAHFSPDGEITRWTETSVVSWFLLPLLATATVALNHYLARLLPRRPQLFNFPGKPQLLELPRERQAPVIARIQDLLHGISAAMIVLLGAVQWATYRGAQGTDPQRYMLGALLVSLLLVPVVLALWLPRIQRELDRQRKAGRSRGGGGR